MGRSPNRAHTSSLAAETSSQEGFRDMGMPIWAQWLGEVLPATHFLRIVRGVLLKENGLPEIWPDLWPLFLFTMVAGSLALLRFRRTLD